LVHVLVQRVGELPAVTPRSNSGDRVSCMKAIQYSPPSPCGPLSPTTMCVRSSTRAYCRRDCRCAQLARAQCVGHAANISPTDKRNSRAETECSLAPSQDAPSAAKPPTSKEGARLALSRTQGTPPRARARKTQHTHSRTHAHTRDCRRPILHPPLPPPRSSRSLGAQHGVGVLQLENLRVGR